MKESTNPFEENNEVLYPRYKDPFTKRTKSVKKMQKAEKKQIKQQHKQEKKDEKARKKQEKVSNGMKHVTGDEISPPNNNTHEKIESVTTEAPQQTSPIRPMNGSSTLPPPTSPNSPTKTPISGYQTLHVRTAPELEAPRKSPVLANRRIAELKTIGRDAAPIVPPKIDTTLKKQIYIPSVNNPQPESITRPTTLAVPPPDQITEAPNGTDTHATSPLARTGRTDDDVTRVRRSASVSKVKKEKKKRKRKLRNRFKKKKKKTDRGEEMSVLEDPEAMNQVRIRKKEQIALLQQEVAETKEIVRNSVVSLLNQRDSMLEVMLEKSVMLEEKAYDFAQAAQEAKLKQKAKSTCCGFGSKYRVCWYICACERGIRRKNKSSKQGDSPEDIKLLSPRDAADLVGDTEDDSYKSADSPNEAGSPNNSRLSRSNATKKNGKGFTGSTSSLTKKLTQIPVTLRESLPNLAKKESPGKGGSEGTFPRRKTSSVGSAQEVTKKTTKKQLMKEQKEKEKREQSYRVYADAEFEDEETRSRAISLLRMDDKRV